jgi:Copper type II ascorbate-dependent monooxygenase, C-terminal domain
MYWTSSAREHQVGIMTTGDPQIGLFGEPVGNGLSKHEFLCPSSCSETVNQEVTVLREYLHLHETGKRIVNEQIRGGEVIRKGVVEHWDFHQNGNAAVQQGPYTIKPGDGFKTTCYYDDPRGATFGLASADEMCMAFIYYYPRAFITTEEFSFPWTCGYDLGFPQCDASYTGSSLTTEDELEREFGATSDECSTDSTGGASGAVGVSMLMGCMISYAVLMLSIVA